LVGGGSVSVVVVVVVLRVLLLSQTDGGLLPWYLRLVDCDKNKGHGGRPRFAARGDRLSTRNAVAPFARTTTYDEVRPRGPPPPPDIERARKVTSVIITLL
jgi:hypothetical protein